MDVIENKILESDNTPVLRRHALALQPWLILFNTLNLTIIIALYFFIILGECGSS